MMDARKLKERLITVNENKLQLEDEEINDLTYHMLPHIGSTDPELRDELIYMILVTWIDNHRLSKMRMKEILRDCLNEKHVLLQIGEINTDSVLTRSFSSLIITSLLWYHNHTAPYLEEEEILNIKETMFKYAQMERDFRGYVLHKGWAHSIAHLGDCLNEIALCHQINQEDLKKMLSIIGSLMSTRDMALIYGEDERMVHPVLSIINRNLLEKETVTDWIHELSRFDMHDVLPNDLWHAKNIKNLFRSLYFRTIEDEDLSWVSEAVLQCLKEKEMKYK